MNTYYEGVLKNPQEDRLRWEWLEQAPNALMELQLNRARRDRRGDGSRRGLDLYEEKIFLEQYPQLDAPSSFFQLTYERGLIQHVRGSYELIRHHGAEILASYPILQLSFYEIPDCALMPIEMNQLQNIVALDLYLSQARDIKVTLGSQFYIESQQYTVVGITVSSKGGTVKFRDSGEFWIHT
ncbi:MAG: hypothetical protein LVT47_14760 [Cyanobacteria bacterium LVE1205-1]|jgi:hypothetical protein